MRLNQAGDFPGIRNRHEKSPPEMVRRAWKNRICSGLILRLCLAKADHAVALFPLAALPENFDAFETLEDIAPDQEVAGGLETGML
jgi:hypothetical protein